jgi:hypothetical protein
MTVVGKLVTVGVAEQVRVGLDAQPAAADIPIPPTTSQLLIYVRGDPAAVGLLSIQLM